MKRLMVWIVITLAWTTVFLRAGSGDSRDRWLDPHSHENVPFAIVKDESGEVSNIQYSELAYGSERYLMVMNADCDSAVSSTEACTLTICPGPGCYVVSKIVEEDSVIILDTLCTDSIGELSSIPLTLGYGEGVLLHFDPITPVSSYSSIKVHTNLATRYVNGRKLVIDRFGRIHICYYDFPGSSSEIWYARSDDSGSTWLKQRVDTSSYYPSIALDTFGVPFITYRKTDSDGQMLSLWSEGGYDPIYYVANFNSSPTFAIDRFNSDGAIYHTTGITNILETFQPNSFPPAEGSGGTPRIKSVPVQIITGPMSCAFGDRRDAVALAVCTQGGHEGELYRRLDRLDKDKTVNRFYSGNYGNPSAARQGSDIWAVYYQSSTNSIRYKVGSRGPTLKNGTGTSYAEYHFYDSEQEIADIDDIGSGFVATSVQIAEGKPFVVWQNYSTSPNVSRILYSYLQNNETWSTPDTVSSNGSNIYEVDPHVAVDYENQKVYVMWTQYPTGSGDTTVSIAPITFANLGWDLVRVVTPNGNSEPYKYYIYLAGEPIDVTWLADNGADSSVVSVKYYPSGDWTRLGKVNNDTRSYTWEEPQAGKCKIKVTVYYPGDSYYDLSDNYVQIWSFFIEPSSNAGWEEEQMQYNPGGASKEIDWEAFSCGGLSVIDLQASEDGGSSFMSVTDSTDYDSTCTDTFVTGSDTSYAYTYTGTTHWTTPSAPTSNGCLRLMAVDTTSDTVYSYNFYPFAVAPPGGFAYNTYSNQNIMSLNDDGDKIGLVFTAQDPDDTTDLSVLYMESDEGLDFSTPDTIASGCWPAFSAGACCWQNVKGDSLFYSYQVNDTFSSPYNLLTIPNVDSGRFAPVGILSVDDTVHMIVKETRAFKDQEDENWSGMKLLFLEFLETSPTSILSADTLFNDSIESNSLYDPTKIASHLVSKDASVFAACYLLDSCLFTSITPSGFVSSLIGAGSHPHVSLSEGNIVYSYTGSGDTTLIRLWRYLDDTAWVERDTIHLSNEAEYIYAQDGLMYGVQRADTSLADLYTYDPISENLYLVKNYTGHYPHAYIDSEADEFSWINAYSDYVDSATSYLHTERSQMNVIIPALYLESDDRRSPYTVYRDTCIHYTSVDVDSASDSLTYMFPHLNASQDYAVIVEFYTECDSSTQLVVQLGTNLDTITIPANSYSWYEQDIASSSDTMALAIRRISQAGFVPVSRIIVRQRSSQGIFMMLPGVRGEGPVEIPFCLYQPLPNPFNDVAMIRYSLPNPAHVKLKVYDISGRLVTRLVDGQVEAGVHELQWRGYDDIGRRCASGIYFVRYEVEDYVAAKKVVFLK